MWLLRVRQGTLALTMWFLGGERGSIDRSSQEADKLRPRNTRYVKLTHPRGDR